MSYAPSAVHSETWIAVLKWPDDKMRIAFMSLDSKQKWYASQDPKEIIFLSNEGDFLDFWELVYIKPLKLKRAFYRLKFW